MATHAVIRSAARRVQRLLAALLCLAVMAPAFAGRSCEEKPTDADQVIQAMALAQRTQQALDASGAEVALIARAGQDLSKYNLRFSHVGIVWRDHPQGRWLVVHELNECATAHSSLYNEGLGNFFMDDMYQYQSQIIVPSPEIQARLAQLLASNTMRRLHEEHYNMLSYVFSTQYQNSNQWVLEAYAAASNPAGKIETRSEAQAWLKQANFQPITLSIPAATRLGARMLRANVAFDDHPFARRMTRQIDTVTVDSVVRFMHQQDLAAREIELPVQAP